MGYRTILSEITICCLLSAASAGAKMNDDAAPASAAAGTIMVDSVPTEKLPGWLQVGGQVRGRFESPSGTSLLNSSRDSYYLSRIRVDLGVKPFPWLRLFAEAQDARVGAYNTAPVPSTIYNPMDLRQGYVELAHEGRVSERFRAGRQELEFGGGRLISPSDWGMSRSFDAIDVSVSGGPAKVDLFAGSPVLIDATRFDRHKPGEHLYGVYTSWANLLPSMTVEPYVLFKTNVQIKSETGVPGDALVVSPGARLTGKAPGRLDYIVEVVVQRGSYSSDRISSHAASAVAGWTVSNAAWKPRLSAEYTYASGDAASKDGARNTFDPFYPGNHSYYGMIDQFCWKNLKNYRAGFDFVTFKKLKVRGDFNEFYLATVQDGLYSSSGSSIVLNRKATSSHLGWELNSVALYQWSKIWKFGGGLGHLWAGDFLKQSKYGLGYTYPYFMLVGSF